MDQAYQPSAPDKTAEAEPAQKHLDWTRNIARCSAVLACAVAALLVVVAAVITVVLDLAPPPGIARLDLFNFELDMFKAILAGFVVAIAGILIPAIAGETRQRFEQRKESRAAYSEAKTGLDYLKLALATEHLAPAIAHLQKVHTGKHLAQLYDDFPEWIEKRYPAGVTPRHWDDVMYDRLFAARMVLEKNADRWDHLKPAERIALLDPALPSLNQDVDPAWKVTKPT